jgi:hypothetical protein
VKYLLALTILLTITSCGKKDDSAPKADQIDINCVILRNQDPTQCESLNPGESGSNNEVCKMGYGPASLSGRVIPRPIKSYVDSGQIKLYNTVSGKYMKLTPVTATPATQDRPNFFILQHPEDTGLTTTVSLPVCSAS